PAHFKPCDHRKLFLQFLHRVLCTRAANVQAVAEATVTLMKSRRRIACSNAQEYANDGLHQGFVIGEMGCKLLYPWFSDELRSSHPEHDLRCCARRRRANPNAAPWQPRWRPPACDARQRCRRLFSLLAAPAATIRCAGVRFPQPWAECSG